MGSQGHWLYRGRFGKRSSIQTYNCKQPGACHWYQRSPRLESYVRSCHTGVALIWTNLWWHGPSHTSCWARIHFSCHLVLPSCSLCYTSCTYLALFVWSGSRLGRWLWWCFATSPFLHSTSNGNGSSKHRMSSFCVFYQGASSVASRTSSGTAASF